MMRFRWHGQVRFLQSLSVIGLSLIVCAGTHAQSTTAATSLAKPQPTDIAPAVGDASHAYADSIISADDVLEVYAMDVPELSRQYRVSPSGTVDLPLLPNPVPAAGLTPSQLSDALAQQLREKRLVTDPHIVVTIVSSRVKAVSITGAVKMPQIYPVFGRTTLLDV